MNAQPRFAFAAVTAGLVLSTMLPRFAEAQFYARRGSFSPVYRPYSGGMHGQPVGGYRYGPPRTYYGHYPAYRRSPAIGCPSHSNGMRFPGARPTYPENAPTPRTFANGNSMDHGNNRPDVNPPVKPAIRERVPRPAISREVPKRGSAGVPRPPRPPIPPLSNGAVPDRKTRGLQPPIPMNNGRRPIARVGAQER